MTTQATTLQQRQPSLDPTIAAAITRLTQFRPGLYEFFPNRADALMDLVDALTGNVQARSPVELSLNSLFRREYGSVYDAIDNFFVPSAPETAAIERRAHEQKLLRLIAATLPAPKPRKFWLFGIDKTPAPLCRHPAGSRFRLPAQHPAG